MSTRQITFEDIARWPAPGQNAPGQFGFSADGRYVTYLYSSEGTMSRELWVYDRESGREWRALEPSASDQPLSREEELRRERQRAYGGGVTGHAWSRTGNSLLVQTMGDSRVQFGIDGEPVSVAGGPGALDVRLSRDGGALAFVRDGELWAQDLRDGPGEPRRLTFDASEADSYGDRLITNGLAEFVAQEEMHRFAGYWWSWDGALLAFEQVDSSPVPYYFINHPGSDEVELEAHRYPFAGKDNVRFQLGVVPARGGAVRWLPLPSEREVYLARVHWTPDNFVIVQLQSRDQTQIDVVRIDPSSGDTKTLWSDEAHPWFNLHDDFTVIQRKGAAADDYQLLWSTERSGVRRLELRGRDGGLVRELDSGGILIDRAVAVDADGGDIYFEGWDTTPLERHLFRLPLGGGAVRRLTAEPGVRVTGIAPDYRSFVEIRSSVERPPVASLRSIDGVAITTLPVTPVTDPRVDELEMLVPEFFSFVTEDGDTLHAAVYKPSGLSPDAKAPVLVDVYGGPHVQQVTNSWGVRADLRAQRFAQQGFYVLTVDNRGSARRGLLFEGKINRNLGDLEVQDQAAGVRALAERYPGVDLDRVGVYGWSYGGYMTLMCLARAPELFKAGVAGAPVTDMAGYDTHYTERYMGTPENNPDGYRAASVMTHVKNIRGKLLIVHGMIDENVHFRHTGRLLNALIRERIPHETLLFPEERHAPRRLEDRVFLEQRLADFLEDALLR